MSNLIEKGYTTEQAAVMYVVEKELAETAVDNDYLLLNYCPVGVVFGILFLILGTFIGERKKKKDS